MSDPKAQLQEALKDAMKNKNNLRRDVIRMAQSAIKQIEIDTRKEIGAEEVIEVLQKEAKKRRETISDLQKAGRGDDAIAAEQAELTILEGFLPRQLTREELENIVKEVIQQTGAESPKDMNKVMGPVMARVKGVADGKLVNQVVKELLGA